MDVKQREEKAAVEAQQRVAKLEVQVEELRFWAGRAEKKARVATNKVAASRVDAAAASAKAPVLFPVWHRRRAVSAVPAWQEATQRVSWNSVSPFLLAATQLMLAAHTHNLGKNCVGISELGYAPTNTDSWRAAPPT
jgi:hypothetical protein